MTISFVNLPDEILNIIVRQLSRTSVRQVSLSCKRFRTLVLPQLFPKLDLGRRSASQVRELYKDLLVGRDSTTIGILKGQHIPVLTHSFIESCLDEHELQNKQEAVQRVLNALQSVSTLQIEFSISEHRQKKLNKFLLPAIGTFFQSIRAKAIAVQLSIDVEGYTDTAAETGDNALGVITAKLAALSLLFPHDKVSSLRLNGVAVHSIPPGFIQVLKSSTLKELSLQDCNKAFNTLPAMPTLEDLALTWSGQDVDDDCALAAAFQICYHSANSLKTLTLRNMLGRGEPLPRGWSGAITLPELTSLHLSDRHLGSGSLFETIFSYSIMSKLRTLTLEMEDILHSAGYVREVLPGLPNLRYIKLVEAGKIYSDTLIKPEACDFDSLQEACQAKNITIECTVKCRCDTPEELKLDAQRLAVLASSVTSLSLNIKLNSLIPFNQCRPLVFPSLDQLSVTLSDSLILSDSRADSVGAGKNLLKALLAKLICPKIVTLQVTAFVNSKYALQMYEELGEVVRSGIYPNLENLAGAMMAALNTPSKGFEGVEADIRSACRKQGIDCSGMTFVSREELGYSENADDDESITSDEESTASGEWEDEQESGEDDDESGDEGEDEDQDEDDDEVREASDEDDEEVFTIFWR